MALKKGFVILFLLGLFACNIDAAIDPDIAAALIEQGVSVYRDIVKDLKDGVKSLFIADELTRVAKVLLQLNIHMQKKQTDSLKTILGVNTECLLAIDASRVVVMKLRNICDDIVYILNNQKNDEMLKLGVETFVGEEKKIDPDVAAAIEKLTRASANAVSLDAELMMLDTWANMKKAEIGTMTDAEIAAARSKAYGSAAACVIAGPLAIIACPIAYAIAGGVTEGKNVKEIQKKFDVGIQQIEKMRKDIKSIGDKTLKLVQKVNSDKSKMLAIQSTLDQSIRQGGLALQVDFFFNRFKSCITDLFNLCKSYLVADTGSKFLYLN